MCRSLCDPPLLPPSHQAHTELSLEVSALGGAALDAEQRAAMATAAVAVLALPPEPTPALASSGSDAAGAPIEQQQQQQGLQGGMAYTVAGPDSPWLSVLPLSAGFFDPLRPAAAGAAGATGSRGTGKGSGAVRFAAAVWSNAPIELPLAGAEVQLVDARGSFAASLLPDAGKQAGAAGVLALPPGAWLRLVATIPVRCSGQLEALAVVLRFGDCSASTLAYQLPALLPGQPQAPSSPRAGQTAAPGPAPAVGWLRGGWTSMQPPFSVAAGCEKGGVWWCGLLFAVAAAAAVRLRLCLSSALTSFLPLLLAGFCRATAPSPYRRSMRRRCWCWRLTGSCRESRCP